MDMAILANLFSKSGSKLTTSIELSATDKVWHILFALIVETVKKKIFTVESKRFSCYAESNDFKIGKLGYDPTTRDVF